MNLCELNICYKRSFKEKYDPITRLCRYLEISLEQTKKKLKDFQNLFKEKDLAIVVHCNLKIENYINITLNLSNVAYGLYRKPSKEINPFWSGVTFLYPLKMSENQSFSDVFMGYRNVTLD